jgi:hypothetical protein
MPEKESESTKPTKSAGRSDVEWKSDKSQIVQIKEALKKLDQKEKK